MKNNVAILLIIMCLFISCMPKKSHTVIKDFSEVSNSLFKNDIDSIIMYCSCLNVLVDSGEVLYFPCFSTINLSKEDIIERGGKSVYRDKVNINLFKSFFCEENVKQFRRFNIDNGYDTRLVQLVYYTNNNKVDTLINIDKSTYMINEEYIFKVVEKKENQINDYYHLLNFCNE